MLYSRELLGSNYLISREPTLTNPSPLSQEGHVDVIDMFHIQFYKNSGERFFSRMAWTLSEAEGVIAATYGLEQFKLPPWKDGWPSMHGTVPNWPPEPPKPQFTDNEIKIIENIVERLRGFAKNFKTATSANNFGSSHRYQTLFEEFTWLVETLPENIRKEVKLRYGVNSNNRLVTPWQK